MTHPEQDRADGYRASQAGKQLISYIGRFQRGEYQHVGIFHLAKGVTIFDD